MSMEIGVFIRQDVGIWNEVEVLFAEFLLHFHDISTEFVFPGNFVTGREMIYFLEFIEAFVEVLLTIGVAPQDVPFMRFCVIETVML